MAVPYNFSPETLYEFYYEHRYTMIDNRRQFDLMLELIKKEKKLFGEHFGQSFKIQRAKSLADSEEIYLQVRQFNQLLGKHQQSQVLGTVHQINLSASYSSLRLVTKRDHLSGDTHILQVPFHVLGQQLDALL